MSAAFVACGLTCDTELKDLFGKFVKRVVPITPIQLLKLDPLVV